MCSCTARARQASRNELLGIKSEPAEWLGIPNIEPRMVLRIDGNPVALSTFADSLLMQGDDDQIVPYKEAVLLQAKLIKNAKLKVYEGYPHGMLAINADIINNDILNSIKS
jgi:pimeloyl-ACP methyl ester carboxylesterase